MSKFLLRSKFDRHILFEWILHTTMLSFIRHRCSWPLGLLCVAVLAGCGSPEAKFRRYETFAKKTGGSESPRTGLPENQWRGIDEALAGLFGTPDQPIIPAVENVSLVLDQRKLERAAGPVHSDELWVGMGLYREHCAHCHGVTGDGNGPTAPFLNPYPRDYRPGWFKFKSTPLGAKPTHADLKKILIDGIPGTAMPSFKLLPEEEVEALVQYVKYLAIRGETERRLIVLTNEELDEGERLVSFDVAHKSGATEAEKEAAQKEADERFAEQLEMIKETVSGVIGRWAEAESAAVEIPQRPAMTREELVASRQRGRDLFYGTIANCAKCHGDSALGDGTTNDYDNWTKDIIDPGKPDTTQEMINQYVALGFPEPRPIKPRNLRQGVFRGGSRPIDLYWRIKNGIEGSPMPAATPKPEDNPFAKGLTPNDVWDIVNYVYGLQFDPLSQQPQGFGNPLVKTN